MASWSNTDAVTGLATARYTVAANAAADGTVTVTGTGSSFGIDGSAGVAVSYTHLTLPTTPYV